MALISDTSKTYRLRQLFVSGVWGYRVFDISFRSDVNILIGKNGSGKTTLLNMISNILLVDFAALANHRFDQIRLSLVSPVVEDSREIHVTRNHDAKTGATDALDISIYDTTGQLSLIAQQTLWFRSPGASRGIGGVFASPQPDFGNALLGFLGPDSPSDAIVSSITSLTNVTSLSVHRTLAGTKSKFKSSDYDSTVDQRIEDINGRLDQYIISTDSATKVAFAEYQKNLLSYLLLETPLTSIDVGSVGSIDLEHQRENLEFILTGLGIPEAAFSSTLDRIYQNASASLERVRTSKIRKTRDVQIALSLMRAERINSIWREYAYRQLTITEGRRRIVKTFDDFFSPKTAFIAQNGRIYFRHEGGEAGSQIMEPRQLSSGEKQIFILMVECLLQDNMPAIFMADEPELSLHVTWQEKLISSMRTVNPNAQLVFATHSPDVVGPYDEALIDLDA